MNGVIKDLTTNLKDKFGNSVKFESQNSKEINFFIDYNYILYQIAVLGSEKKILFLNIRVPEREHLYKDEFLEIHEEPDGYFYYLEEKYEAIKLDNLLAYFCAEKGLGYTPSVKYVQ